MGRATLAAMIEFHRARLLAVDNWATVQTAMTSPTDRVASLAQALQVSELGALSVLAMTSGTTPDRSRIESQLDSLEYVRALIDRPH